MKRILSYLIILLALCGPALATSSTIWGAPHASVAAGNRIPVDTSNLSGPGYNTDGDILGLLSGDCTVTASTGQIICLKTAGSTFAHIATSGLESDLSISDITTNNVTTSKHGLAPKLNGNAAYYLDGTGNYSVPAATALTLVNFTGDGTVLSSTPSTGPNLVATLANAAAKSILGNATVSSASPSYVTSPVVSGSMTANTLVSTVATGTAPLTVTSTTVVSNLSIGGNAATATTAGTLTGALSANQLLGSLTAVAPTGQSVPSCSTSSSALLWTSGTGFSCNTSIAAATATSATSATTATTATNATNTAITDDTSTNATMYPTWVTTTTGNLPQKISSTKLSFNPSTGALTSTSFSGAGTGLTGTASSLTAGNVTTNANLTGPITSVGNAVASLTAHAALIGNGASAIATVAPGTSGNVMTSNGTDWVSSAASGGFTGGGIASGRYYSGELFQCAGATIAVTANRLYGIPFRTFQSVSFTKIGLGVTSGAGNMRVGLYAATNGIPGALITDYGAVTVATAADHEITIAATITPGDYFIGVVFDNTPTVEKEVAVGTDAAPATANFLGGANSGSNNYIYLYRSFTYGALPNPFAGSLTYDNSSNVPFIYYKP